MNDVGAPRREPWLAAMLVVASVATSSLAGCGAHAPRMSLLYSEASGATWSFVVKDSARAAQILIDGRPRTDGCNRAGVTLRCELRGLFPGGHTLELNLAGGVLRRTVLLGASWSERPVLVRARDVATVTTAGQVGADGVLIPFALEPLAVDELVEAAHKGGIRVLVEAPAPQVATPLALDAFIERGGLDGVVGASLPADTARRFPSTRSFALDQAGTQALATHLGGAPMSMDELRKGAGLIEARGAIGLGLALLAGRGAIADGGSFVLLGARRRHKALREGKPTTLIDDGQRRAIRLQAGGDMVTMVTNASSTPFAPKIELPPAPIDLLGGPMLPGGPEVPPGQIAVILASPDPAHTH